MLMIPDADDVNPDMYINRNGDNDYNDDADETNIYAEDADADPAGRCGCRCLHLCKPQR